MVATSVLFHRRLKMEKKIPFPSLAFFQTLQTLMRQDEARFRRLGFIDTTFGVHVVGPQGQEWRYQLAFEVFDCHAVTEVAAFDLTTLDFVLTGELAAWVEMLHNIRQHGGADVAHSLNTLTHFGERLQMLYADPDNRDKFFRFQESLQEFFDLASALDLEFPILLEYGAAHNPEWRGGGPRGGGRWERTGGPVAGWGGCWGICKRRTWCAIWGSPVE